VAQLGANVHGEVLEPGRVPDCYVGLLLRAGDPDQAPSMLVVSPTALLHPAVPQPDGTLVYELVTGHPDRAPRALVFLADLTVELRAWPADTWTKVGIDPQAAAGAVVAGWQRGDLLGLRPGWAERRGGPGLGAAGHDLRAPSSATGSSASLPGRTGGGGSRPAAGRATGSCSRGHLQAGRSVRSGHAVRTPILRTATAVPEAAADRQGVRALWFHRHQAAAAVSGCPAGCGRTAADPQPPLLYDGSRRAGWACSSALVTRARSTQPAEIGCPDARTPEVACRTSGARHCGRPRPGQGHADAAAVATLDSLQQNRPLPLACPAGNGTTRCGTGQHARRTAGSVAWCSASIWSAPDGSACSGWVRRRSRRVQTGPVGSSG
jgi:hypothetical protein